MSAKTRIVVVLGMHRSGTSAITRGLQALGIDLGESLLPPLPDNNEKGFFEDSAINGLNIELLHVLGSDWHALRGIAVSDFSRENLAPFKLRAIEILREKTRDKIFGFKDPRAALLLDFWQEIFQHLDLAPSYVIAVRHPLSVAQSLKSRDGFAREKSYYLWLQHVVPAILKTAGYPRIVVDFDVVMANPELQLERLARFLKLPFSAGSPAVQEYTTGFLDGRLRHSRFALEDLHIDDAAPYEVIKAYETLSVVACDEVGVDAPEVAALFAALAENLQKMAPALRYMTQVDIHLLDADAKAAMLASELAGHEGVVRTLSETIDSLVIDRDARRDGYDLLQEDIKRLMKERPEELAALNSIVAAKDEVIASLSSSVAAIEMDRESLTTRIEQLQANLARLSDERSELKSSFTASEEAVTNLTSTVESLIVDRDAQRDGYELLQEDIKRLTIEHTEKVEALNSALAAKEAQMVAFVDAVAVAEAEHDSLKTTIEQLQNDIRWLRTEHAEQVEALNTALADKQAQIAAFSDSVAIAEAEQDSLKTTIEQLRADLEHLLEERDQLSSIVAERDEVIAHLSQSVSSLVTERDAQLAAIAQLESALRELGVARDEHVTQLNADLVQCGGLIADLRMELESLAARSNQTITTLSADLEVQTRRLEEVQYIREQELAENESFESNIRSLQTARGDLGLDRAELLARLLKVDDTNDLEIKRLSSELAALYESTSWRVTSPLRAVKLLLVRVMSLLKPRREPQQEISFQAPDVASPAAECASMPEPSVPTGDPQKKTILLVSYYCPSRAHAGGLRILDLYALIREQQPDVCVDLFTHYREAIDWSIEEARAIFHNVYLAPTEDLSPQALHDLKGTDLQTYDVVDLQFHQSGSYIDAYRSISRKIIFTPMESQARVLFLRFLALLKPGNPSGIAEFKWQLPFAKDEIRFCRKVDQVVCVSHSDAAFLRTICGRRRVRGIDTGISAFEFAAALDPAFQPAHASERRRSIIYVAYFGSETNVLALRWYLENVHQRVLEHVPDYVLTVVGRGDLSSFEKFRCDSVEFVGEVPAIAPYIAAAGVGIAPALGGSGFRGKVNQYAIEGIPCVGSPIALKGLAYRDGVSVFEANTPKRFADRCIKLLTDVSLNDKIAAAARQLCIERYSWMANWPAICGVYGFENPGKKPRPLVTALVPSYNHQPYIRERIESILAQTYPAIEIIVIDDCSDDDSDAVIRDLQSRHGFQYIRNKRNSGTPFSAWEKICDLASGDFIWVCESDDVAEPEFVDVAMDNFTKNSSAVLFYSGSTIIDEKGERIGDTNDYFHDVWQETRWDADFQANGKSELLNFQVRGQVVPNMSSALFTADAFKAAFRPFLKRLRLTGDWLFVGDVLRQGDVMYSHLALNRFRKHAVTSRERVKSARSQAEFILTKYHLFRSTGQPVAAFAPLMLNDVIRFLYEPASWWEVTRALLDVSVFSSIKCALLFLAASCRNPVCLEVYRQRYRHAQEWRASNGS